MKKIVSVILTFLVLISSLLTVSAEQNVPIIDIKYSENISLYTKDSLKDGETLNGMSANEFSSYMEQNSIYCYGMENNGDFIVTVTISDTSLSQTVNDFYTLSAGEMATAASSLVVGNYSLINKESITYIVKDDVYTSGEKEYLTRQYITIKCGRLIVITFNYPTSSPEEEIIVKTDNFISSVSVENQQIDVEPRKDKMTIIVVIAIAVVSILGALLLLSIIKDFCEKRKNDEK